VRSLRFDFGDILFTRAIDESIRNAALLVGLPSALPDPNRVSSPVPVLTKACPAVYLSVKALSIASKSSWISLIIAIGASRFRGDGASRMKGWYEEFFLRSLSSAASALFFEPVDRLEVWYDLAIRVVMSFEEYMYFLHAAYKFDTATFSKDFTGVGKRRKYFMCIGGRCTCLGPDSSR